ncbi:UNVERIFIED_CONTAM: hypothetical protein Slati_4092900 [Sesamum latifolium]|uniref:Uncharacterized protein n=1 Tax=Sesamum latifolium TaxID=2727402 RepID=A0AAW2T703_9LAMI
MEVDKGRALLETESKDFVDSGAVMKEEYEGCIRCLELQDKLTKANDKCGLLEIGMGEKNAVIEWLESKVGLMELKKLELEDEVRVLKERNQELEKSNGNGEEEEEKVTQLMIENNVLECEKRKAESEVEVWKVKYISKTSDLGGPSVVRAETENKANEDKDASGNLPVNTPSSMRYIGDEVFKGANQNGLKSRVRKCLDFAAEERPHKNISPSTPGDRPPFGPIDVSDSDDDLNATDAHLPNLDSKGRKKVCSSSSTNVGLGITLGERELTSKDRCVAVADHQIEEEAIGYIGDSHMFLCLKRRVRRGVVYIVTSESENDSDDNIPICKLRKHVSESSMEYDEVISGLRRERKDKNEVEYEADMLADLVNALSYA